MGLFFFVLFNRCATRFGGCFHVLDDKDSPKGCIIIIKKLTFSNFFSKEPFSIVQSYGHHFLQFPALNHFL